MHSDNPDVALTSFPVVVSEEADADRIGSDFFVSLVSPCPASGGRVEVTLSRQGRFVQKSFWGPFLNQKVHCEPTLTRQS